MAQKSEITKKYRILSIITNLASILLLLTPLLVFGVKAFIVAETVEKLALGALASTAIVMSIMNLAMKIHLRSPVWLCLLGIYFILENIMPLIIVISLSTIIDELIISPLHKKFKNQLTINKEIDKRL